MVLNLIQNKFGKLRENSYLCNIQKGTYMSTSSYLLMLILLSILIENRKKVKIFIDNFFGYHGNENWKTVGLFLLFLFITKFIWNLVGLFMMYNGAN